METDLFLEMDYPLLHISTLEDVYINFGVSYLLTTIHSVTFFVFQAKVFCVG